MSWAVGRWGFLFIFINFLCAELKKRNQITDLLIISTVTFAFSCNLLLVILLDYWFSVSRKYLLPCVCSCALDSPLPFFLTHYTISIQSSTLQGWKFRVESVFNEHALSWMMSELCQALPPCWKCWHPQKTGEWCQWQMPLYGAAD